MFWSIPWYTPYCEIIKLKAARNLIEYYLGNFLEKITLDQLSVNFYNGTGIACDLTLKCDELNKFGDKENWPLLIKQGRMEDVSVIVPWTRNSKDDSILKINGLTLTVHPKTREEPVISALNWISTIWSYWSKWSSCKVCLNRKEQLDLLTDLQVGQMDFLSDAIYSKLKRINVKFVNTKIIVEHTPKDFDQCVSLEIYIKNFDYYEGQTSDEINAEKKIVLDGIKLLTAELSIYNSKHQTLRMQDSLGSQRLKEHKRIKIRSLTPGDVVGQINTVMHDLESQTGQTPADANENKELTPKANINLILHYWMP